MLALLYIRRRTNPDHPEVSLFEVESRMGFPRDYLDFTIWYLQKKEYITRADNSAFTLTVAGVDFVETQRLSTPVLQKLLASRSGLTIAEGVAGVEPTEAPAPQVSFTAERRRGKDRRKRA